MGTACFALFGAEAGEQAGGGGEPSLLPGHWGPGEPGDLASEQRLPTVVPFMSGFTAFPTIQTTSQNTVLVAGCLHMMLVIALFSYLQRKEYLLWQRIL